MKGVGKALSQNQKETWVFAEQRYGKLNDAVYELLAKSRELAGHDKHSVCALLLGDDISTLSQELIARGADEVILIEHPALGEYSARPYAEAICAAAKVRQPDIILYAATDIGRDVAPRVMVGLDTGLTADAIDLGYDEEGAFCQTTPAYGGSILAHIAIPTLRPQMSTVRVGIATPLAPDSSRQGIVTRLSFDIEPEQNFAVLSREDKKIDELPISEAEVIVSGGRGIKNEEEYALVSALAEALYAETACSRPLVDVGMLPHSKQIGQSGAAVKPKLIVNVAISGSVQYMIGMDKSEFIVSINRDKSAPIFDISHVGIVADYKAVLPALTAELLRRRQGGQ